MPLFHHRSKAPDKGFGGGSVSKKCRVPDSLHESVWICWGRFKNQTCLIFFTTVTDPHSPLPTNIPVSYFLRPPQTQIYTILGCLGLSGTVNARSTVLIPGCRDLVPDTSATHHAKSKTEISYCSLRRSVISPRKSKEVSDQSETQLVCPRQDLC